MSSDNDQDTDYKTSQEIRDTSFLLQTDTGIRTPEQQHIIYVQWILRGGNRIPEGESPRLWLRIPRHQ